MLAILQHSLALVNLDSKRWLCGIWRGSYAKPSRSCSASLSCSALRPSKAKREPGMSVEPLRTAVGLHMLTPTSPVTKMPLCWPIWATSRSSATTSVFGTSFSIMGLLSSIASAPSCSIPAGPVGLSGASSLRANVSCRCCHGRSCECDANKWRVVLVCHNTLKERYLRLMTARQVDSLLLVTYDQESAAILGWVQQYP